MRGLRRDPDSSELALSLFFADENHKRIQNCTNIEEWMVLENLVGPEGVVGRLCFGLVRFS